jgi:hypothetical protein
MSEERDEFLPDINTDNTLRNISVDVEGFDSEACFKNETDKCRTVTFSVV